MSQLDVHRLRFAFTMLSVNRFPIVLVALVLLAGCQRLLAPSPNLYVDAVTDPFADVPAEFRTNTVDILYATDRKPESERNGSVRYGYDRSAWLAFGSCTVEIGHDVSWPRLVEASRSEKRTVSLPLRLGAVTPLGRFPQTPPPLELKDGELTETDEYLAKKQAAIAKLHDELRRRLALTPRKEAFVFVHGYKNTLEKAAFRLAELWHFLGRQGVPVLYTWPAGAPGLLHGYTRDRESGEFTIFHLKEFITALAACPELERISIIAHSRGTDIAATALRELVIAADARGEDPQATYKIAHLIIAAPDIDAEVSGQRNASDRLFRIYDHSVVYVSPNDRALGTAEWLFASPRRMGKLRPEHLTERDRQRLSVFQDGEIVDSRIRSKGMGHNYFLSNPATLSDLILVLRYDRPPTAEGGRPLTEIAPNWYILDDNYPRKAAPLPKSMRGK